MIPKNIIRQIMKNETLRYGMSGKETEERYEEEERGGGQSKGKNVLVYSAILEDLKLDPQNVDVLQCRTMQLLFFCTVGSIPYSHIEFR